MNLFLDISALVKLYHNETGSDNLSSFLNKNSQNLILSISDFSIIEMRSALLRRVRMNELTIEYAQIVLGAFEVDLNMFQIVDVNAKVKTGAIQLLDQIAYQEGLRSLDAIQLSSAHSANDILPLDRFITCDTKLAQIASRYFEIFNPGIEKTQ